MIQPIPERAVSASQAPGSLTVDLDVREESRRALGTLIDKVSVIALTLGTVGTTASVLRVISAGWHANVVLDIVFFSAIVGMVLLRRTIPTQAVLRIILGLVLLSSVANFMTLGLLTIGFTMLASCSVIAAIAFGVKTGIMVLGGSTAAVLAVGASMASGLLPRPELSAEYQYSPLTWLSQAAGFLTYTSAMLATIASTRRRLARSMKRISQQAGELRESEENYRLLAENVRDVLFKQNLDHDIVYVSPSIERLFGYTPEECMRLTLPDLLTPESLVKAQDSYRRYFAEAAVREVRVPPLELEYIRKDGSTFWCEMRPTFLRDTGGNVVGTQGILIDLTERRQNESQRQELESRLRQSEKLEALGQLAGGVAHDFNNQLVGVVAFAQLLKEDRPDDPLVAEYADNILAPARRAAELTNKLLAFARKGAYRRTNVNVHDIIDEVVTILQRSIDKSIKLVRHYEAASAVVHGDASQLQNAILNVGLNARDAMPDGGEVVFSTRILETPSAPQSADAPTRPRTLELTVADSGTGMTPEVAERIFEPFYTTKEPGRGTGMGLAAVHGTVEAHGGTISVASTPGTGSTFTILLPLVDGNEAERDDASLSERAVRGQGTILVVDDEDTVRAAVARMLRHLGYGVHLSATGLDALAYYDAHADDIDLVLLDLILPEMRGAEVMQQLQRIRGDVKVVIASGYAADQDIRALEGSGAAGFLRKPFTTEELSRVLAKALRPSV